MTTTPAPPTAGAETIVRPNGKPYRRRKPIRADQYQHADGEGLLVMGTHDVDRARAAYESALLNLELQDVEPQLRWLRVVPWDAYGLGVDSSWIEDPVRGVPCVDFMPDW